MSNSAPGYTERTCPSCGVRFLRRSGKSTGHCLGCATGRLTVAATEAKAKAGPTYEKAVRGQLRYWQGEANRLGIT